MNSSWMRRWGGDWGGYGGRVILILMKVFRTVFVFVLRPFLPLSVIFFGFLWEFQWENNQKLIFGNKVW